MKNKGLLIVLSGPSGCGKGTMVGEILKRGDCAVSVSATTRSPREGEENHVHYHFLTREEFEQRIAEDGLLESNRAYRDLFRDAGFDLTYYEGPGGHEWDFWDDQIRRVLDWLPLKDAGQGVNSGNVGLDER